MINESWSVTTVVRYLKNKLDNDSLIQSILVKGEVSNFTRHTSGHFYFTLKDQTSRISCVMFRSNTSNAPYDIKNGMQLVVNGSISMFEATGAVQLYARSIVQDGIGDLYQRLEFLKNKLLNEGYFDEKHKKTIPRYISKIALVTGNETAARKDVLTTIKRRWPLIEIDEFPCLVQGTNAYLEISDALLKADNSNADVILLVRGGGSIEDLWSFNEELVVKTIFKLHTPIISGIGHEIDTTLADLVSDRRAATPTAAAELASVDRLSVQKELFLLKNRMLYNIKVLLEGKRHFINNYQNNKYFKEPTLYISEKQMILDLYKSNLLKYTNIVSDKRVELSLSAHHITRLAKQFSLHKSNHLLSVSKLLQHKIEIMLALRKQSVLKNIDLLQAYSPLNVIKRGYSVTYKDDKVVNSIDLLNKDDQIITKLKDGNITSIIMKKEKI